MFFIGFFKIVVVFLGLWVYFLCVTRLFIVFCWRFFKVSWFIVVGWLAFMFEDDSHTSIFDGVSGDSGGSGGGRCDVFRRLLGGDLCKRAIFDVLSGGGWCSVFELCRAARSWDRGVGMVRVSTILKQFQQVLGSDFLESRMGGETAEWRVGPGFLRGVAGVLSEKVHDSRVEAKGSEGFKDDNVRSSGGLLRNLLGKTL